MHQCQVELRDYRPCYCAAWRCSGHRNIQLHRDTMATMYSGNAARAAEIHSKIVYPGKTLEAARAAEIHSFIVYPAKTLKAARSTEIHTYMVYPGNSCSGDRYPIVAARATEKYLQQHSRPSHLGKGDPAARCTGQRQQKRRGVAPFETTEAPHVEPHPQTPTQPPKRHRVVVSAAPPIGVGRRPVVI